MKKKLLKITATLTALITFMLCLSIYVSAATDQLIRVKLSINSSSVSIKVGGDYHIDGGGDLPTGSYTVSVSGSKIKIERAHV